MRLLFVNAHERLFIEESHPRHHLAPVALGTAMGFATEAGFDVDFVETSTGEVKLRDLKRIFKKDSAEIVILHPTYELGPHIRDIVRLALCRDRKVFVAGGPATHRWRAILEETDAHGVITGEIDDTPSDIARALLEGLELDGIGNLAIRKGDSLVPATPRIRKRGLDSLPFPRHDLLTKPKYRFYYPLKNKGRLRMGYLMTSRGCPYSCVFCSEVERSSFGKGYEFHSPKRVTAELKQLAELGVTGAYFVDDLLSLQKKQLLELCRAIEDANTGISWCAQLRADDVDDEVAIALKNAGCASVACGIESGSDRMLKSMKKGSTVDGMFKGVQALKRAGVSVITYLIIGAPGETEEDRNLTLRLGEQMDADIVQIHIFASYPGTAANASRPDLGINGATKFSPASGRADEAELIRVQKAFYRRYYLRPDRLVHHAIQRIPRILSDPQAELGAAWRLFRHATMP